MADDNIGHGRRRWPTITTDMAFGRVGLDACDPKNGGCDLNVQVPDIPRLYPTSLAYVVTAYTGMPCVAMAYIVMAYIVITYIVMAHIVVAQAITIQASTVHAVTISAMDM